MATIVFSAARLAAADAPALPGNPVSMTCIRCHGGLVRQYRLTPHGRATSPRSANLTCVSCHTGDAPGHIQTAGLVLLANPAKQDPDAGAVACMDCHGDQEKIRNWRGTPHQKAGLGCQSCHGVHKFSRDGKSMLLRTEAETCFSCHGNLR